MERSRQWRWVLRQLVSGGGNDRSIGAIPVLIGSNDARWTPQQRAPVEQAQDLLNKYVEVLVQRGLHGLRKPARNRLTDRLTDRLTA